MFSRIRYAAKVLSYTPPKVSRFDEPDIAFEERSPQEVTKTSARIGTFIEVMLLATIIGSVIGPLLHRLMPSKETTSLLTLTGIAASIVSVFLGRIIDDLNYRLRLQLRIGERIAPYFGHKIHRAIQILRG